MSSLQSVAAGLQPRQAKVKRSKSANASATHAIGLPTADITRAQQQVLHYPFPGNASPQKSAFRPVQGRNRAMVNGPLLMDDRDKSLSRTTAVPVASPVVPPQLQMTMTADATVAKQRSGKMAENRSVNKVKHSNTELDRPLPLTYTTLSPWMLQQQAANRSEDDTGDVCTTASSPISTIRSKPSLEHPHHHHQHVAAVDNDAMVLYNKTVFDLCLSPRPTTDSMLVSGSRPSRRDSSDKRRLKTRRQRSLERCKALGIRLTNNGVDSSTAMNLAAAVLASRSSSDDSSDADTASTSDGRSSRSKRSVAGSHQDSASPSSTLSISKSANRRRLQAKHAGGREKSKSPNAGLTVRTGGGSIHSSSTLQLYQQYVKYQQHQLDMIENGCLDNYPSLDDSLQEFVAGLSPAMQQALTRDLQALSPQPMSRDYSVTSPLSPVNSPSNYPNVPSSRRVNGHAHQQQQLGQDVCLPVVQSKSPAFELSNNNNASPIYATVPRCHKQQQQQQQQQPTSTSQQTSATSPTSQISGYGQVGNSNTGEEGHHSLLDTMHRRCYPAHYSSSDAATNSDATQIHAAQGHGREGIGNNQQQRANDQRARRESEVTISSSGDKSLEQVSVLKNVQTTSDVPVMPSTASVAMVIPTPARRHPDDMELTDACLWLKAAGFPQYARMYEDGQTVSVEEADNDHQFLDFQLRECLLRRIRLINEALRPQSLKHRNGLLGGGGAEDGEPSVALSAQWKIQPHTGQWVRSPSTSFTNGIMNNGTDQHHHLVMDGHRNNSSNKLNSSLSASASSSSSLRLVTASKQSVSSNMAPLCPVRGICSTTASVSSSVNYSEGRGTCSTSVKAAFDRRACSNSNDVLSSNKQGNDSEFNNTVAVQKQLTTTRSAGQLTNTTTALLHHQLTDADRSVALSDLFDDDMLLLMGEEPRPKLHAYDAKTLPNRKSFTPKRDSSGHAASSSSLMMATLSKQQQLQPAFAASANLLLAIQDTRGNQDHVNGTDKSSSSSLPCNGVVANGNDNVVSKMTFSQRAANRQSVYDNMAASKMAPAAATIGSNGAQDELDAILKQLLESASTLQLNDDSSTSATQDVAIATSSVVPRMRLTSTDTLPLGSSASTLAGDSHKRRSGTHDGGRRSRCLDGDDDERDSVHTVSTDSGTVIYVGAGGQHRHLVSHAAASQCVNCTQCTGGLRVDVTTSRVDNVITNGSTSAATGDTETSDGLSCSNRGLLASKDDVSPSSDSGLPSSCSVNSSCAVVGLEERLVSCDDIADDNMERGADDSNDLLADNDSCFIDDAFVTDNGVCPMDDSEPGTGTRETAMSSLSAGQLVVARQLCLLHVTSLLERHGHTVSLMTSPNHSNGQAKVTASNGKTLQQQQQVPRAARVFGVSLDFLEQTTGNAVPACITALMEYLYSLRSEIVGVFRRPGVHSQVLLLKQQIEQRPDVLDLSQFQPYDVADVLRHFYRDLPECLLTNRISSLCLAVYRYLPASERLTGVRMALALLPDSHLVAFRQLLQLLRNIAQHASTNQMTTVNLAICFAPSIFRLWEPTTDHPAIKGGMPTDRQLREQQAAQQCLVDVINCSDDDLFVIPFEVMCDVNKNITLSDFLHPKRVSPRRPQEVLPFADTLLQTFVKGVLKVQHIWVPVFSANGVEVSYRQLTDSYIPLWRVTAEIEAPPNEILSRIISDRGVWEEGYIQGRIAWKVDQQTDVFQYSTRVSPSFLGQDITRSFCELRCWKTCLANGACALVSTSVAYESRSSRDVDRSQGTVLASHYYIQPCGVGRSSLVHFAQIDFGGFSPKWYKRCYGQMCVQRVKRLCEQFQRQKEFSDVPETPL